jgi:hypothetical protein
MICVGVCGLCGITAVCWRIFRHLCRLSTSCRRRNSCRHINWLWRSMSSCHWSNRENYPSSDSSDSSESATYLNLDHSARSSRRSSNCSDYLCIKGHQLLLLPVTFERNTACGCCSANIRMKPAQVLCYHCNECDYDACGDCVSDDMKQTLRDERSRAMVGDAISNLLHLHDIT